MAKKMVGLLIFILLLLLGSFVSALSSQTVTNKNDTTPPSVWFSRPCKRGIYIESLSFRRIPFPVIVIIGSIHIWAHASDDESEIEYCELYIDDELKVTFNQQFPRSWAWSGANAIPFSIHTIKGVAYDTAGNSGSDEIIVWKFF